MAMTLTTLALVRHRQPDWNALFTPPGTASPAWDRPHLCLALVSWVPRTVLPFVAVEPVSHTTSGESKGAGQLMAMLDHGVSAADLETALYPPGWKPGPLTSPPRRRHAG